MPKYKEISDTDKIMAVLKNRSISKAAKELGLSQSSLSRAVREIEEDYGVQLFVRSTEGTELSEAGEMYVDYLWQVRDAEEDLRKGLEFLKSSFYRLNIALPLNISFSSAKDIEKGIHKRYPDAEVHFFNVFSNKVPQGILSRKYDMAISWDAVEDDPRFRFEPYYEDHLILLVPAQGPAVRSHFEEIDHRILRVVNVSDIRDLEFVIQDEGTSIRETIDELQKKYSIQLNTRLTVSNSMLAIRAAEEGIGCAIVMEAYSQYVSSSNSLNRYVLNDNVGEVVGLITLSEKELTPLEEYAAQVIRDFLEERNRKYSLRGGQGI